MGKAGRIAGTSGAGSQGGQPMWARRAVFVSSSVNDLRTYRAAGKRGA